MISKKKAIFLGVILVIITAMVTSAFQLTLGNKVVISKELYEDYKKYDKLLGLESIIKQDFYKKVSDTDLVNGASKGLFLGTNDKYCLKSLVPRWPLTLLASSFLLLPVSQRA